MDINVVSDIPFPIQDVYLAMRDHMPELAEFMPNVASIEVESRDSSTEGRVQLVNRWNAAATEIPTIARPFIDPANVYWLDHAEWVDDEHAAHWRLEMGFMAERVSCQGTTSYHRVDEHRTEMRIQGTLTLDLKGMVPRLLLSKVTKGVEAFVGNMVQPNFQKTSDALTAYLERQSGGPQ